MGEGRRRSRLAAFLGNGYVQGVIVVVIGGVLLSVILGAFKGSGKATTTPTKPVTTPPSIDATAMSVSCSPASLTPGSPTTCTGAVTDTASSGATTPTGSVSFSSSPTAGSFGRSGNCTLAATPKTGVASCRISFTPAAADPYTVSATYGGDSGHHASSGQSGLITATTTGKPTKSVWGPHDVTLVVNRYYTLDHPPITPLDSCDNCVWVGDYPGEGVALQAADVAAWSRSGRATYRGCANELRYTSAPAASLVEGPYATGVQPGGWLCAYSESGEILVLQYHGADPPGNSYYFTVTAWPRP